jgi:hypothetical protein
VDSDDDSPNPTAKAELPASAGKLFDDARERVRTSSQECEWARFEARVLRASVISIAPSKLGKGGRDVRSRSETLQRNLAGGKPVR